jgi:hypothetical protein
MMNLPVEQDVWTVCETPKRSGKDWILCFGNGIAWQFPAVMEDGTTEDEWYAYFLPHTSGDAVHIGSLQKGSQIKVAPSRFDFQFLD